MPVRTVLAPVGVALVAVVLWFALAAGLGPALVPSPTAVLQRLVLELGQGDLQAAAGATLGVSLLGCLIGLGVALPLGYTMAHSRTAYAAFSPWVAATQAIPAVALAPLLALWLGYDVLPKALLCALLVFFPILINTVLGLTQLDRDIIDAARVDGAGAARLLVSIEAPLAAAAVLSGVRNGFILSVTGSVVGEFVIGGSGLGQLLSIFRDRSDTTGLVTTLVVLAGLAIVFNTALRGLERKLTW